jgi:hypothetical protein
VPFQNTGTVLENIVVLEAARVLMQVTGETGPLTLASAFAMPTRSPWRHAAKYAHEGSLTDDVLDALAQADRVRQAPPTSYPALLHACLRDDRSQGPNGALLVAVLAQHEGHPLRLWLNDLPPARARYGASLPTKADLQRLLLDLLGEADDDAGHDGLHAVATCDVPYPDSLDALQTTLARWTDDGACAARLGFLDPNVYHADGRDGPETSSDDHRAWLRALRTGPTDGGDAFGGPVVAVHFTAKRHTPTLHDDLRRLHQDGTAAGYPVSAAYMHRHYAVHASVRGCDGCDPNALADALDAAVTRAWDTWCAVAVRRDEGPARLHVYADGEETDLGTPAT